MNSIGKNAIIALLSTILGYTGVTAQSNKNNFDKQKTVAGWYGKGTPAAKDSLNALIKKELYHNTTGTLWPVQDSAGSVMRDTLGNTYARMELVGKGKNGMFPNAERTRWLSPTYSNIANATDMSLGEFTNFISVNEGMSEDSVRAIIDSYGYFTDAIHSRDGPVKGTSKHVYVNPHTGKKQVFKNHLLLDEPFYLPLRNALVLMGYNVGAAAQATDAIALFKEDIKRKEIALEGYKSLSDDQADHIVRQGRKIGELSDKLGRWRFGPSVSYNNTPDAKWTYGAFTTLPIMHDAVKVEVNYTPMDPISNVTGSYTRVEVGEPNQFGMRGVSETTKQLQIIVDNRHRIGGSISLGLGAGWFAGGGGGVTKEKGKKLESVASKTYNRLPNGERLDENTLTATTPQNYDASTGYVTLGVTKFFGPIGVGGKIAMDDNGNTSYSGTVSLDIGYLTK